MAAKVALVAVPTVLGIASIRVYTVNDVPADGLVSQERLNIYTPLSESAQAKCVPESPGVIERGLTTAREGVLPLVQAVKGACISVKRGSVNLYHAGEDAYYYLMDPPPGFLPRFGTVTMAGLLGMFLARRGSRFKRMVVPLGLMGAGASLCYPAQAVAVVKVTGKNAYAAGQWSSAAVSSLLSTSKPAAAEEMSHTQSATEQSPHSVLTEESSASSSTADSSSQSSAIQESEVESAEPVPVSDEPIVAVTTEEESSLTLTEISPAQAPPETGSGSLAGSIPVQTETSPPFEEAAHVGNKGDSDETPAAADVSTRPAEPTLSLELETVPVESASAVSAEDEAPPLPEHLSSLQASDMPSVPTVESESAAELESADQQSVPVKVTPTLTPPPPPPQQPSAENSEEGSGFKPDPALMDFGQSTPEDEDLYSTRS